MSRVVAYICQLQCQNHNTERQILQTGYKKKAHFKHIIIKSKKIMQKKFLQGTYMSKIQSFT